MSRVLIASHEADLSEVIAIKLAGDHEISIVTDAQGFVVELDNEGADLLIVDLGLTGHNGFEILHELQSHGDWGDLPIVALSNLRQQEYGLTNAEWQSYGVQSFVYKPELNLDLLSQRLRQLA